MTSSVETYKAFVSSTFIDLKDHRAHVINSLRNAGFFVDPMENWTADSDEPKKFSQDRLHGCDLCVLVVAFRRGFVPDGESLSITQMEYDTAVKQGIDILPFVLAEDAAWPRKFDELDKDPGIQVWRAQLQKSHGIEPFSLDPRSIDMTGALGRWWAKKRPDQFEPERIKRINWPKDKSPYPGLEWFDDEYAPLFFGRDREVNELIGKMNEPEGRVLLVIGASGSGKSSVVAAGVWQAVVKQGRLPGIAQPLWHRIQPGDGDTPFDALARKLKEVLKLSARPDFTAKGVTLRGVLSKHLDQGQELILFVDQLEELFTRGFEEPAIQTFLEQMIGTAQDQTNRLRVVTTIRSEFVGKLEAYGSTLNLLNSPYRYHLGPLSPRMLQDMIEKPAEATGYRFESGLVEPLLQDTGQEPGNLPLVAYALKQLFERRKDQTFTVEAYEAIGGVVGAIATKANEALSGLDKEVQGAFDRVFAELVRVERERPPTRNRAAFSAFSADPNAVQFIDTLAGQNCRVLVTSGRGQEAIVEVAHEKLFSEWPTLRDWIAQSGEDLRLIEHEEEEARRWHEAGARSDELWKRERAENVKRALTRFKRTPSAQVETMTHPQKMLIERLNDASLSHSDRLLIGQKLAEFGDTREGVGVKNGVPDIKWIKIPGGKIKLEDVNDEFTAQRFRHEFTVKPFRIAKYSLTNVQFEAFLKADDGYGKEEWWKDIEQSNEAEKPRRPEANSPREMVSWYEAVAFCRWLSTKIGTRIRLPTEWEWQHAATSCDPQREYPWQSGWSDFRCNSGESGLNQTTAVGMYPAGITQQGIDDMAGNISQWCQNKHWGYEQLDALSIDKLGWRVFRGSSFADNIAEYPQSLKRFGNYPDTRLPLLGFRLVQDIEP